MRTFIYVMGVLGLTGFAFAQDKPIDAPVPKIENVISSLTFDFNNDGMPDRAVMVETDIGADLYIYQGMDAPLGAMPEMKLIFYKKDAVYSGGVFGQLPSLDVNERGSLKIKSENVSIGRNRWTEVLTIGYRTNQFMVLGVTYTAYDTLNTNSFSDCDLNLVSGKSVRKGKSFAAGLQPVSLADWSDDKLPRECLQ